MAIIGYARVSTPEQSLDRQLDQLREHGCERTFAEAASGKRGAHRPEWDACLGHLRRDDTLAVCELSRLGRNTGDLGRLLDDLDARQIGLVILNLGIDTKTAAGRLIFSVVAAVAEMERELLIERTQSGLAAARARGRVGGRRRTFTSAQQREAQRLYDLSEMTVEQVAKAVGTSTSTVYRYLKLETRSGLKKVGANPDSNAVTLRLPPPTPIGTTTNSNPIDLSEDGLAASMAGIVRVAGRRSTT